MDNASDRIIREAIRLGLRDWLARTAWYLLFAGSLLAQDNTRAEFWPETDIFVQLNAKSRLYFVYSATKTDDRQTYADGGLNINYDWYGAHTIMPKLVFRDPARTQLVMFRAGYQYTVTPEGSNPRSTEHTPTVEAHARAPLPWKILASDRNRFDLRLVDGRFLPRYRNRVKVERTFKIGRFELNPYAHVEVFYDWRWNTFNRYRYAGGMEWSITKWLVLEGYNLTQRDTKSSPEWVNAEGVALQIYFHRGY